MGCFGSREDARRKAFADDYQGTDYAFSVGSIETSAGFCPLDALVLKYCGGKGKEIGDGIGELKEGKIDEKKATEIAVAIHKALKELEEKLRKTKDGEKEGEVMNKYTGKDAYTQVNDALTFLFEKSKLDECKWPAPAELSKEDMEKLGLDKDGKKEEGKEEEAAGGENNDGGDGEGEAPKEGEGEGDGKKDEGAAKSGMGAIAASDFGDIEGGAVELAKIVTVIMFAYPIVGDCVKAQVMHWELGGDSGSDNLAAAAALSGAYVNAGEKAEDTSYGAAWLTNDDLDELNDVLKDNGKKALVFPGVVGAFADEKTALG